MVFGVEISRLCESKEGAVDDSRPVLVMSK